MKYIIPTAIQVIFALAFLANRDPNIHWCAMAPLAACICFLYLKADSEE